MSKNKNSILIKNEKAINALFAEDEFEDKLTEEEDCIMLRLKLPKDLMQKIDNFQEEFNLYHSVSAIRYLLNRGLMTEEVINKRR